MKILLKPILKYYLLSLTKLVLWRARPFVIAVAGSVNKGFVKDEIAQALKEKGLAVRVNDKNFNTEIGLPLAILGLSSGYNSYRAWAHVLKGSLGALWQKDFPPYLVLDLGVSDPGDMAYLLGLVTPRVVVVSEITQRYLEGFEGMDELVGEYEHLVSELKKSDLLVLNTDNYRVAALREKCKARVIGFGTEEISDCRITDIVKTDDGQRFVLYFNDNNSENLEIKRFGRHNVMAAAAARIVAREIK